MYTHQATLMYTHRCTHTYTPSNTDAQTPSNTDVDNLNTDTHRLATLHTIISGDYGHRHRQQLIKLCSKSNGLQKSTSTLNLENGTHKQLTGATTEFLTISLFQNHVIIIQTTTYAQRNEFHHSNVSSNSSQHLQTYITKSRTHKTCTGSNGLEVPKKWRFKSRDRN